MGGYAGTPSPELLTRWFEVGAFQPIYRDHTEKGTGDQEPWVGGQEHEAIRRKFIEARYRLLPYLYTLTETGVAFWHADGCVLCLLSFPMQRLTDIHSIRICLAGSEFMLGPNLLVAPRPYPDEQDPYTVELPSEGWYDYWTGEKVVGTAASKATPAVPDRASALPSLQVQPALDELPVFVRVRAPFFRQSPLIQSTSETPTGPLTLKVYAAESCSGELYQDDGKSPHAYQRGVYLRMNFTCHQMPDGMQIAIGPHEGSYAAWWKDIRVEIYGSSVSRAVITADSKTSDVPIERTQRAASLTIPDSGRGFTIELK